MQNLYLKAVYAKFRDIYTEFTILLLAIFVNTGHRILLSTFGRKITKSASKIFNIPRTCIVIRYKIFIFEES